MSVDRVLLAAITGGASRWAKNNYWFFRFQLTTTWIGPEPGSRIIRLTRNRWPFGLTS